MKASSTSRPLALLTIAIPLLVMGAGWLITGELSRGVIVSTAAAAAVCQILLTLKADLQTVIDVEYEVYQSASKKRQERLLEWQERQDRTHSAARLHDSVINTLCAASMMTPGTYEAQLQARCRHDLEALQEFAADSDVDDFDSVDGDLWLAALSESVAEHSTKLGLTTKFETHITDVDGQAHNFDLDKAQQESIELAVRECMTNIAKHAVPKVASVVVEHDGTSFTITVTDQGPGWRTQLPVAASEFSLFALGHDVQVAVSNDLDGGLRVQISPASKPAQQRGAIRLAVRDYIELPLFRTVNFWLTGLSIIIMVMFFEVFTWYWWLLTALVIVSSSMAMTNLYSLSRKIPQALVFALAAGSAAVVASPALLDQPQLGHWYVLASVAILLVTASWVGAGMSGAWATWAAIVLGAVVLATQQTSSGAIPEQLARVPWLMVGVAVVFGAGIVGGSWWVRGVIDESTERTESELGRAAAEEDLAELHAKRIDVRQRLVGRCMAVADPMLSSIANGQVDLGDEAVRSEIRYIERLLRSAISLGRESDQLSELLFDLLWSAYDQDVEVKIASYRSELLQTPEAVDQLRQELECLVGSLPAGSVVNVSTYDTDKGAQLLLVSQSPGSEVQGVHEFGLGVASQA